MKPENEEPFHTEWIEQYLSGELQGEDLEQFNRRLHNDTAFRQEVALQRSIVSQAQLAGREEMHQQLKSLHRRLGFTEEKKRKQPFYYAIAAAIFLLLAATIIFYLYLPPTGGGKNVAVNPEQALAKTAIIRCRITGRPPAVGFSGTQTDSTTTILLYPAPSAAYQFNDTLRLYGNFTADQLSLQYDEAKEQYTLTIDTVSYSLKRFRPKQALQPTAQ